MCNKIAIKKAKETLAAAGVITENEDLFTKNVWRKMGFRVNKEEIPVTKIPIFVYAPHNIYDDEGNVIKTAEMLEVNASFYTLSQVTEIKKGA